MVDKNQIYLKMFEKHIIHMLKMNLIYDMNHKIVIQVTRYGCFGRNQIVDRNEMVEKKQILIRTRWLRGTRSLIGRNLMVESNQMVERNQIVDRNEMVERKQMVIKVVRNLEH